MRILEIGESPYVFPYAPAITDFYAVRPSTDSYPQLLTLGKLPMLRSKLRAGHYDLVVYCLGAKALAPWHRPGAPFQALINTVSWTLFDFHKIGWHHFHSILCGTTVPLVVIDVQDAARLTKSEAHWLDRCRFWFMRELPPNHLELFLNMDRRCGDVVNISRHRLLRPNFNKIEPFSLGVAAHQFADLPVIDPAQKIHDVFFSGATHTTTVRQKGLAELLALRDAGVKVHIPETRLSRPEFLETCARSWMVWSPEGQGWDCYRHYEALMTRSVPLINSPTTERHQPFIHGEHCLYYRPETGGLTETVNRALADRNALLKIAEQGRAHILRHHSRRELLRHVLGKLGVLAEAEPHLLSDFPG
jgi:hypothetical protein